MAFPDCRSSNNIPNLNVLICCKLTNLNFGYLVAYVDLTPIFRLQNGLHMDQIDVPDPGEIAEYTI
jgi:hypothetical protein